MKTFVRIALVLCGVTLLGASPPSFDAQTAQVLKHVNVVVAAYGSPGRSLAKVYASNAVIVDGSLPPFRWSGADCGNAWLDGVKSKLGLWKMSQYQAASPHFNNVSIDGDDAVVTLPLIRSGRVGSRTFRGTVMFTFVLRKVSGAWTITAQSVTITQPLASGNLQLV